MKINRSGTTLVDQVELKLIEYFKENGLRPGSPIPNEAELSVSLGIGRTVLREALSRFKMTGMIRSRTKRGMTLAEPSILCSLSRCVNPLLMSGSTIRDLFEFRLALETGLIPAIFRNITDEDIRTLENIVEREKTVSMHHPSAEQCNFHDAIYRIVGNKMAIEFQETIRPILDHVMVSNEKEFTAREKELAQAGKSVSHGDLLDLIRKGDEIGYVNALNSHYSIFADYLGREAEEWV